MISRVEQTNWTLVWTTIFGLLFAVFLGVTIANSDYRILLYFLAFFGLVAFVSYFQRVTWQLALLLCYLGFFYRPAGFDFGPNEVTCFLAVLLAAVTIWHKRPRERLGVLESHSFSVARTLILAWLIYVAIHMAYNIASPLRPSEFVLKNALKTYFTGLMPPFILWYFSGNPAGIRIKGNVVRTIAILLLVGVVVNLIIVAYGLVVHVVTSDLDSGVFYTGTVSVPGINARDNPFMLRNLGPLAVLLGATVLSIGPREAGMSTRLSVLLILLGAIGGTLSGGRAALATAVFLLLIMMWIRKQAVAFLFVLVATVLIVLGANVFSGWINRDAPLPVARTLQWVMFTKSKEASGSIENSSQWREELFHLAIDEWKSDPRIFWFGRATYGFGVSDLVNVGILGGYEALKESSLRRGATHNLITDLLVTYGLVGCILYYALNLAIIRFLWVVYKFRDIPPPARCLSLFCLLTFASYLMIASVGGGLFLAEMAWLAIILIATLYQCQPGKASEMGNAPAPHRFRRAEVQLSR